jgi:hypothetical protein
VGIWADKVMLRTRSPRKVGKNPERRPIIFLLNSLSNRRTSGGRVYGAQMNNPGLHNQFPLLLIVNNN